MTAEGVVVGRGAGSAPMQRAGQAELCNWFKNKDKFRLSLLVWYLLNIS